MTDWKALNKSVKESIAEQRKIGMNQILAAFDCETTGANLFHGDLPFLICMTFENKETVTFEWDVNPITREVFYEIDDLVLLVQYLQDPQYLWIGHNIKFDVRCVEKAIETIIGQAEYVEGSDFFDGVFPDKALQVLHSFDPVAFLENAHDTHLMSHAVDNRGSHGLKDLAVRFLDIPEDDVHELKQITEQSRAYGKSQGWLIASPSSRPLDDQPDGGWWIIDLWTNRCCHGDNPLAVKYCLRDTERTLLLFVLLRKLLCEQGLWYQYLMNQRLLAATYQMESVGASIKMETLIQEQLRFRSIAASAERTAKGIIRNFGVNLNAPEQVAYIIHNHFDIPIERETAKGKKTINKDELEILYTKFSEAYSIEGDDIEVMFHIDGEETYRLYPRSEVRRFLDFSMACMTRKKCIKAANSDLQGYYDRAIGYNTESGSIWFLHSSINIVGTDTTRISASDPNLTNVSKGKNAFNEEIKELNLSLRKVFGPRPGKKWVAFDGSQLQLVIAATISGEKEVLSVIERGGDLHEFMHKVLAEKLHWNYDPSDDGQRTIAKNTNFGFWFGAGRNKIDKTTHTEGIYDILCETFPNAQAQIHRDIRDAERTGYVEASGYRLYLPSGKPYAATVYKVQGWEGKIMKRAAYDCSQVLQDKDVELILFVHDELIYEMDVDESDDTVLLIRDTMIASARQEGINMKVGIKVIMDNWQEGIAFQAAKKTPPKIKAK